MTHTSGLSNNLGNNEEAIISCKEYAFKQAFLMSEDPGDDRPPPHNGDPGHPPPTLHFKEGRKSLARRQKTFKLPSSLNPSDDDLPSNTDSEQSHLPDI